MPNPENTVQVATHRAGEGYLDTCELKPDAIRPATRAAVSFRMTLPEFLAAEQEGTVPGQEDLRRVVPLFKAKESAAAAVLWCKIG